MICLPSLTIPLPWLRNINFIERTSSTEGSGSNTTNSEESGTVSLHLARWIALGLDMFCDLNEVIGICLLLEDKETWDGGCSQEDSRQHVSVLDCIYAHIFTLIQSAVVLLPDHMFDP